MRNDEVLGIHGRLQKCTIFTLRKTKLWAEVLWKERPVRLRAYQAGLWGCLTNPGRVGGLVGSSYNFRGACCSSYQNLMYPESCRQQSGFVKSGALLTGLTVDAFFDL